MSTVPEPRVHCPIYPCPGHANGAICAPDPIDAWQNAPLSRDLPTEPVRTVRERFIETVAAAVDETPAELAWQLVLDAWRVIEVADARGEMTAQRACVEREVWYAALRVAIFRADQPGAPELSTEPADPEQCPGCGQVGCSVPRAHAKIAATMSADELETWRLNQAAK